MHSKQPQVRVPAVVAAIVWIIAMICLLAWGGVSIISYLAVAVA